MGADSIMYMIDFVMLLNFLYTSDTFVCELHLLGA